ncbi:MAG: hypothetical protein ABL958_08250 [Bdellovibrionia bacterium]
MPLRMDLTHAVKASVSATHHEQRAEVNPDKTSQHAWKAARYLGENPSDNCRDQERAKKNLERSRRNQAATDLLEKRAKERDAADRKSLKGCCDMKILKVDGGNDEVREREPWRREREKSRDRPKNSGEAIADVHTEVHEIGAGKYLRDGENFLVFVVAPPAIFSTTLSL